MIEEYSLGSFHVTSSFSQLQGQVQNSVLEVASIVLI